MERSNPIQSNLPTPEGTKTGTDGSQRNIPGNHCGEHRVCVSDPRQPHWPGAV